MTDFVRESCNVGLHQWGPWVLNANREERRCLGCGAPQSRPIQRKRREPHDPYAAL